MEIVCSKIEARISGKSFHRAALHTAIVEQGGYAVRKETEHCLCSSAFMNLVDIAIKFELYQKTGDEDYVRRVKSLY